MLWRFTHFLSAAGPTAGPVPIRLPSLVVCAATGPPADRDRVLPVVTWSPARSRKDAASVVNGNDDDPRLPQIVEALSQGRRVVVQIKRADRWTGEKSLARVARFHRCRATVATWAFDTANPFDLVGLPKLAGIALNPSDLILALEHAGR